MSLYHIFTHPTSLQVVVQQAGMLALRRHAPQHGLRIAQRQPERQVQRLAVGRGHDNQLVRFEVDRRACRHCSGMCSTEQWKSYSGGN